MLFIAGPQDQNQVFLLWRWTEELGNVRMIHSRSTGSGFHVVPTFNIMTDQVRETKFEFEFNLKTSVFNSLPYLDKIVQKLLKRFFLYVA